MKREKCPHQAWARKQMRALQRERRLSAECKVVAELERTQSPRDRWKIEALAEAALPASLRRKLQTAKKRDEDPGGEVMDRLDAQFRKIVLQRAGLWPITLPPDPEPTEAEKADFLAALRAEAAKMERD